MLNKLDTIQQHLKDNNLDFAYISNPHNIGYITGFHSDPHERVLALFIFANTIPLLFAPALDVSDAKASGWEFDINGYTDSQEPFDLITDLIKSRTTDVNAILIEKDHLIVERYLKLHVAFPNASFSNGTDLINSMRVIKTPEELAIMKEAAALADYAVEVGVAALAEGKTELDIIAEIEYELKKKGVTEMSFSTMVLTGVNAASPHGNPGLTQIQNGDLVLFDLGVMHKGYASDISRTVAFGLITQEQEEIYNTVLKAQLTAMNTVKAGVAAKTIDMAARQTIADAGYGDYFTHRLGHGLGITCHEFPSITDTNEMILEENMVFTIEPGIYLPNVAGVRIEDDVVVTKDGVISLTTYPKELQIISQ